MSSIHRLQGPSTYTEHPTPMAEDWITTAEASELSGYHPEHLRELIRDGKIRAKKWGRDWQVSRSSLLAYVRAAETSTDGRRGARKTRD